MNVQKLLITVCAVALVTLMLGTPSFRGAVAEGPVALDAGTEGWIVLGILVCGVYRLRKNGKGNQE